MRTLTISRERALAAFGVQYHLFTGGSREEFMVLLEKTPLEARKDIQSDYSLRNGQVLRFHLPEDATATFFAAAFLENRSIVTREITVGPGNEDVSYTIKTLFDGFHQIDLDIVAE